MVTLGLEILLKEDEKISPPPNQAFMSLKETSERQVLALSKEETGKEAIKDQNASSPQNTQLPGLIIQAQQS